jgi:hypothetical protein
MATESPSPADIVRQAIADGELHTTKPVNRALVALLDDVRTTQSLRPIAYLADRAFTDNGLGIPAPKDELQASAISKLLLALDDGRPCGDHGT